MFHVYEFNMHFYVSHKISPQKRPINTTYIHGATAADTTIFQLVGSIQLSS